MNITFTKWCATILLFGGMLLVVMGQYHKASISLLLYLSLRIDVVEHRIKEEL